MGFCIYNKIVCSFKIRITQVITNLWITQTVIHCMPKADWNSFKKFTPSCQVHLLVILVQVAITFATCLLSYNVPGILEFQVDNYWLMIVASIGTIPIAITIFCCPAGRKHPVNIILLLIFTLLEAYIVSYITSIVAYN